MNYCTNSPILECGFLAYTSFKEREDKLEIRKPEFKCIALPNETRVTPTDKSFAEWSHGCPIIKGHSLCRARPCRVCKGNATSRIQGSRRVSTLTAQRTIRMESWVLALLSPGEGPQNLTLPEQTAQHIKRPQRPWGQL